MTTTTGVGAGAGVVDVLDGIIGLTPSLREEGGGEDVGGRKKGEVDDDDDGDGGAGGGRKRARFDPSRDTVLVVPARQKKSNGRPTGEELLALAEEEASDRTALVFEPTLRGARQACRSLDRALRRNRASRDEHPDDPAKFVDDEVALNDAVLSLKDAAADVGLYPELVECGMADSLLTLLGHENVDVAAGAVEVLAELLDPSLLVVVASVDDDGNGGGNASSSSSSGGRAGCVASLANAFVDGGGLDLLSSNLGRLDESVDEEARCAEDALALVESLLDLDRAGALGRGPSSSSPSGDGGDDGERPSVAACICERTSLVPWLFERIGRTTDDPGAAAAATSPLTPDSLRLHSSEVLSAILQHEDYSANMRGPRLAALPRYASAFDDGDGDGGGAAAAAKTVDGMDALLLAVAAHRKSDPTSDPGCEFLENALDALAASLLRHDNVADFVEAEGVELMLRCVRQRVHAGGGALRVLSFAMSGSSSSSSGGKGEDAYRGACEAFVRAGGLKLLFPLYMARKSAMPCPAVCSDGGCALARGGGNNNKASKRARRAARARRQWLVEAERNATNIVYSLTRHIAEDSGYDAHARLLAKFVEEDCVSWRFSRFCRVRERAPLFFAILTTTPFVEFFFIPPPRVAVPPQEKCDRTIELCLKYDERARIAEYQYFRSDEADEAERLGIDVETVALGAKLRGGGDLFHRSCAILSFACVGSRRCRGHVMDQLKLQGAGISGEFLLCLLVLLLLLHLRA